MIIVSTVSAFKSYSNVRVATKAVKNVTKKKQAPRLRYIATKVMRFFKVATHVSDSDWFQCWFRILPQTSTVHRGSLPGWADSIMVILGFFLVSSLCLASFLISSCSLFRMCRFGLFFLANC